METNKNQSENTVQETVAQRAFRLLKEVPAEKFIQSHFTDKEGKCCAIGHFQRLNSANPDNYNLENCEDNMWSTKYDKNTLRGASIDYISIKHGTNDDITEVNNRDNVNGYNEPGIKDRVIHLLTDMVEAWY